MNNGTNNGGTTADSGNSNQHMVSGAKGSTAGVQVNNAGIEEMLSQLHQILAQITQSMDNENSAGTDGAQSNEQLMALANQLAVNLQEQDQDAGESAMRAVLGIIDTLADMLDNGQIAMSKS